MIHGYSLETRRRVYDDAEGSSIEVRPSPDNPDDFIEITTTHDPVSEKHWGEVRLAMPKAMALLLGQALIEQASKP